jgi:hypothetical protein
MAETLPFPLVPAIWHVGRVYVGRREARLRMRESVKSTIGCIILVRVTVNANRYSKYGSLAYAYNTVYIHLWFTKVTGWMG